MGFLALCSLPIRLDGLEASGGEAEANSAILDESIGGWRILSGFQFSGAGSGEDEGQMQFGGALMTPR